MPQKDADLGCPSLCHLGASVRSTPQQELSACHSATLWALFSTIPSLPPLLPLSFSAPKAKHLFLADGKLKLHWLNKYIPASKNCFWWKKGRKRGEEIKGSGRGVQGGVGGGGWPNKRSSLRECLEKEQGNILGSVSAACIAASFALQSQRAAAADGGTVWCSCPS